MKKPKHFPKGTLVTGRDPASGEYMHPDCKGHVWEITSKLLEFETGPPYRQHADCVVCGMKTKAPMAVRYLSEVAKPAHLAAALLILQKRKEAALKQISDGLDKLDAYMQAQGKEAPTAPKSAKGRIATTKVDLEAAREGARTAKGRR